MSRLFLVFLWAALTPAGAWAQSSPKSDLSALFGPSWVRAQPVPGTAITLSESHSFGIDGLAFGFRLKDTAAGALWLDVFPWASFSDGKSEVIASGAASVTGSVRFGPTLFTSGIRFVVPLRSRLSLYGALGAGGGFFHYAVINTSAPSAAVELRGTTHGTFDFGGGIEVSLVQAIGIRTEIRDYVSGTGLDGVAGRHHLAPRIGLAFHF